ncbi:MAG TPA: twin-arginine translocation signal domain-containing protein [Mycobacteriales bacterium]|nr:twin-arginine translocation signal domain-containing protein [Mycobacteriales bacterium]
MRALFSTSVVDAAAGWLGRRTSRRRFLQRVAVVGSALSVGGLDYVLRPGTAYASLCGRGASCSSGWTALCCTVNDGLNRCPPGSFAAGWWKADGASLCGGKARYYIDCQARCTDCGCARGTHFCAQRCWNCKPHCAHNGTCDERRVCANVFRYGQCHQEIHCSGPVWCRAISCTPPWKWEKCSTASATDNNTTTHSAPCLPSRWSPLQARYRRLGSQGSPLGASAGRERDGERGTTQRFQHGRMYWSRGTGAHFVLGAIADRYHRLGASGSPLGLPLGDTRDNGDAPGRHNTFEKGAIYSSGRTGTRMVLRPSLGEWQRAGGAEGPLGLPTSDTVPTRDGEGRRTRFEHGAVYSHPVHGTHALAEDVYGVWSAAGLIPGPLGYPTTDLFAVVGSDGERQTFQGGAVYRHPTAGVHGVWGPIFVNWQGDHGGELGPMGFPTTDVYRLDETRERCDFEHGSLVHDTTAGSVSVV